jgi:hypothetical protein
MLKPPRPPRKTRQLKPPMDADNSLAKEKPGYLDSILQVALTRNSSNPERVN